jgi:hypothetical protein
MGTLTIPPSQCLCADRASFADRFSRSVFRAARAIRATPQPFERLNV